MKATCIPFKEWINHALIEKLFAQKRPSATMIASITITDENGTSSRLWITLDGNGNGSERRLMNGELVEVHIGTNRK